MTIMGISKFIIMILPVILPSINSSFLIYSPVSSKMFFFSFISLLLALTLTVKYISNRESIIRLSMIDMTIFIWVLYIIFNSILHHIPASSRLWELFGLLLLYIPGAGCHGCIQEGELFMKRNIQKPDIVYILTKTSSLKILQQKTGIHINEHSNIYVDTANVFDIPTNNAIYPCIVKMGQGKVISFSFQSPGNNVFRQIK